MGPILEFSAVVVVVGGCLAYLWRRYSRTSQGRDSVCGCAGSSCCNADQDKPSSCCPPTDQ